MASFKLLQMFVLPFLCPSASGKYQTEQNGFRAIVFGEPIDDWAFAGYVLGTKRVASEGMCQVHCVHTRGCESYNLGPLMNGQHSCEISSSNRHRYPQKMVKKVGFKHRHMKTGCDSSPCPDGQQCLPDYGRDTFKCGCIKYGHTGIPCACTSGTALGMENGVIPNNQISASSAYGSGKEAWRGRLNNEPALPFNARIDIGAWASGFNNKNQYLQVDLGQIINLTRVATQGRPNIFNQWVKKYAILYSNDGTNWEAYKENGVVKVFTGNTDGTTVVTNTFLEPFTARYVRINPRDWLNHITLRAELYGCEP